MRYPNRGLPLYRACHFQAAASYSESQRWAASQAHTISRQNEKIQHQWVSQPWDISAKFGRHHPWRQPKRENVPGQEISEAKQIDSQM